jgi:hypothetical protein
MLIVAFGLAYFLSTYITKSLKTISDRINETSLSQKNKKIVLEASSKEINLLIKSYNRWWKNSRLVPKTSTKRGKRREMAKQVAHEIKTR